MKNLIEIIKANPGATARVDSDWWALIKPETSADPYPGEDSDQENAWRDRQELAHSDREFTDSRHGEFLHGAGLLNAFADMLGVNIERA